MIEIIMNDGDDHDDYNVDDEFDGGTSVID